MGEIPLKQCSRKEKCVNPLGCWLPATTEYFSPAKGVKSGLRSNCRACTNSDACRRRVRKPRKGGTCRTFPQHYRNLASQFNIEWIGTFPGSTNRHTTWRCPEGHVWDGTYNDLQSRKHGCGICARKRAGLTRRLTVSDFLNVAASRGFAWMGTDACDALTKTKWQCAFGHEWEATYHDIRKGHGCPYCCNHVPKNTDDYKALAAARGFQFIGEIPKNTQTKALWRCSNGHEWLVRYENIRNGSGCPECLGMVNNRYVSKVQLKLHALVGGEVNHRIGKYAIDVALIVGDVYIAVEYDSWYWHQRRERQDQARDRYLSEHGWKVLRIKSATALPTETQLTSAIDHLVSGANYHEIILEDWRGYSSP